MVSTIFKQARFNLPDDGMVGQQLFAGEANGLPTAHVSVDD
jgi:1,4-dihydroxy-2-naphthoyl-CoA synthase